MLKNNLEIDAKVKCLKKELLRRSLRRRLELRLRM